MQAIQRVPESRFEALPEVRAYAGACCGEITVHGADKLIVITPSTMHSATHDIRRYHFSCFTAAELQALHNEFRVYG